MAAPGRRRVEISREQLEDLYWAKRLSLREIARRLKCDHSTIKNKLAEFQLGSRTYAEANRLYPRRDFDGDAAHKAYLIGFRLGDLHATRLGDAGQTVLVKSGTTKRAQIELFQRLFAPYGHVHIGKQKRDGNRGITAYLNMTFDFLLPKADEVPDWVQANPAAAAAFAAGYIDAEGSFFISDQTAHFTISAYDGGIIRWLYAWMTANGVRCPPPRIVGRMGAVRKSGAVFRRDLWALHVARKESLLKLIELLTPYLKHAKRCADMQRAKANIDARNARRKKTAD